MTSREKARARARLQEAIRGFLGGLGYEEVETPCLVPAPGMEPHIDPFRVDRGPPCAGGQSGRAELVVGSSGGGPPPLWLHTSPEYAMKRLLAAGLELIFQLARVFRDEPSSPGHNPEFTLLELYRAHADYRAVMGDLEELVQACAIGLTGGARVPWRGRTLDLSAPFERLTVAEAFERHASVGAGAWAGGEGPLREALARAGHPPGSREDSFDDLFFRVFLDRVEPALERAGRAVYVVDWPAPMASLSRLKAADARFAERFELYAGGLELANGFSELTDAIEQRRRLVEERELRRRLGRPVLPLDEAFLSALPAMPAAGGVAVGVDRLLMLLTGACSIDEVLLFPASGFR